MANKVQWNYELPKSVWVVHNNISNSNRIFWTHKSATGYCTRCKKNNIDFIGYPVEYVIGIDYVKVKK